MGCKRYKLSHGLGDFVPTSVNFSEISPDEENQEFDPSDDGLETERLLDNMAYEELIVNILFNLETRERTVFLFQILRDCGYQIDHTSFAKVLGLSRRQYMRVLESVRIKTILFLKGYKRDQEDTKGCLQP